MYEAKELVIMKVIMTNIQNGENNTVERVIDGTEREVKLKEQSPLHILERVWDPLYKGLIGLQDDQEKVTHWYLKESTEI